MTKAVDVTKTVYELCTDNPELIHILKQLGFENITKPGMLQTAGRVMTIPNGARMKGIHLDIIKDTLKQYGYTWNE